MAKNTYTPEENGIIQKLYFSLGPGLLAQQLNHSYGSLRYQASKLNLKKRPLPYFTIIRAARFLGVVPATVRTWINQSFLKASKSGRGKGFYQEWKIEPQDFYDFVRDYYYLYDPGQVKDEFLRSIIESTSAAKVLPTCQAVKVLGITNSALTKRARAGKFPVAYKGFGPAGHTRWYLRLDDAAFKWFRDLVDNNHDKAAKWLVETVRLQNPDSILILNTLLEYEPARVKMIRERIRHFSAADRFVGRFEATPQGEKLKNLT